MTSEQKYSEVIKELGALLADKNATISCQKWQIDQLTEKLESAEAERDTAKEEISFMNSQIFAMAEEIAKLEGGSA